ncbi:hypothetical protein J1782_25235 [Rahnella sp. BCC 1045]|uniref:hypothetical protein n=1 Tax=Rahnella sp. BCC 1045 TaxID=2816251 RepID=UPI001C25CBDD|nr:hypothetical protein [Rahnella sp. BCC 1045]MBU9823199.1 hypothetical protein [Rahnella sp. BCC 1045]
MDIEAYKVAVKVSLTENVTAGLLAISRKFGDTNKQAQLFQERMAQIGKMTLAGGALVGVGLMITKGLDATIKAANDLVKAQNDFKTLNLTVQENAQVNSTAQNVSHQILGTTIAGNIRLIQDLHTALGDLHHSIELAPMFAKYESTIGMALGEHAKDGMVNAAARALEHRGGAVVNNPAEFQKELEWMSQVQLASKGRVSPKDFLSASQSGKMAYTLLDPQYLYGAFSGLMSMNGGFQSGTALMTTFSSLIGGHMDKKAKGFLADLGMSEESVSKDRMTMMKNAMKGMSPEDRKIYMQSLGGESLLSGGLKPEYVKMFSNPDQLAAVMADKIRARFGKNLTDTEVAEMIAKNFNRNTGGFLGQHILNAQKLRKDAAIFRHSQDFGAAYDTYLNSPDGAGMALSSAWTNFKAVLGMQLIPMLTSATMGMAKFVDTLSKLAEDHPLLTKFGMYAAAVTAGLTIISGGVMLLGATIMAARLVGSLGVVSSFATLLGGPVVWAIVAAAGASYLLYKNWDKIKPEAKKMGDEFGGIMKDIIKRAAQVGDYMSHWGLWKSLDNFYNNLVIGFNNVFDTIIGYMNRIPGVNLLTSQQSAVKNRGMDLLGDVNLLTGGPKKPAAIDTSTYGGAYANAVGSQGKSSSQSYADGMKSMYQNSSVPVPGKTGQTIQVNSTINMDGKQIATGVTKHQTREATKAPSGPSAFDSSMLMTYPGQVSAVSTN